MKYESDKNQVVTGFFDKNTDGNPDEGEKIFTIRRELSDGEAKYQTVADGPHCGYYTLLFFSIASGMMMAAMLSSVLTPRYVAVYHTAYVTTVARVSTLSSHRSSYRAENPSRFSKVSRSGRTYGGGKSTAGGGVPLLVA